LKRVIQESVQDALAEAILDGRILDGETVPIRVVVCALVVGDTQVVRAATDGGSARPVLH
jgi:ATP-dependent Clp protease ATP-binding subunit ClpB